MKTVLLVEDDPLLSNTVETFLEETDYRLYIASSAEEALIAGRNKRKIDLLLTDIFLGDGMNGKELADRLCAVIPGLRVLYMSGYSAELLRPLGLDDGSNLLSKPFSSADLVRRIEGALAEERA